MEADHCFIGSKTCGFFFSPTKYLSSKLLGFFNLLKLLVKN